MRWKLHMALVRKYARHTYLSRRYLAWYWVACRI